MPTPCVKCLGLGEPDFLVEIPGKVESQNSAPANKGFGRFAYRMRRKFWVDEFKKAVLAGLLGQGNAPRVVRLTRLYAGQCREWDRGNLVGGMKLIVDAMGPSRAMPRGKSKKEQTIHGAGLILSDAPSHLLDVYEQEKWTFNGLRIEIWEMKK